MRAREGMHTVAVNLTYVVKISSGSKLLYMIMRVGGERDECNGLRCTHDQS